MIVICGLNDSLNLKIGKMLSDSLDMFFLDLKKLLEYEVAEKDEVIEKIGIKYLQKLETSAIKNASTFENTVIVTDYDSFTYNDSFNFFQKNSLIIYIKASKTLLSKQKNSTPTINLLNFDARDKQLEKISNIIITNKNNNTNDLKNKIIEKLKEVFL